MLRFYHTEIKDNNSVYISENALYMNNNIWDNCKSFLSEYDNNQANTIGLVPVRNAVGELITYGYQDSEADRELRMIKELRRNKNALQFTDFYSECRKVIIFGCNELAVSFAEYLKEFGVSISVIGKYWNYFGYETGREEYLLGGRVQTSSYMQKVFRSRTKTYVIQCEEACPLSLNVLIRSMRQMCWKEGYTIQ